MAKLTWGVAGAKTYETGIDKCVLYTKKDTDPYGKATAWDGITSISENPSGAEPTKLYADNTVYATLISLEEFGASLEAYKWPAEFEECDGTASLLPGVSIGQQSRKPFGLSYRTKIGNDVDGSEAGYKIHIIYGCMAAPTEKSYQSINESPDIESFSWEISTTPVSVTNAKDTATVVLDSTKLTAAQLKAIEDVLYGTDSEEARLPLPDEIASIITGAAA